MTTGRTMVIAHLGFPTEAFKASMIHDPRCEQQGIEAVVVPVGVQATDYPDLLRSLFRITNLHGASLALPHRVTTTRLVDQLTTTAQVVRASNAILRHADASLLGGMLFEMIPAYLEFFGFGTGTPDRLRAVAQPRC